MENIESAGRSAVLHGKHRWPVLLAWLGAAALLLPATAGSTPLSPQGSVSSAKGSTGGRLEMDVTGSVNAPGYQSGEPEVAISPTNPNEIFIAYSTSKYTGSLDPAISFEPSPPHSCGGMVSRDRGENWRPAFLPFKQQTRFTLSQCANGVAAFGPDGTLYAGGAAFLGYDKRQGTPPDCSARSLPIYGVINGKHTQLCIEFYGTTLLARSTNGGKTWTKLPRPLGTPGTGIYHFAPGLGEPPGVFDRPWLAVDQSTGVIYFSAAKIGANRQRFVTASTDKGNTWGLIYAIDSPSYPQAYYRNARLSSSNIAVAKGVLAVAYVADPARGGCKAKCLVFATSSALGATWNRHIVPLVNASLEGGPDAGVVFVAANPAGGGDFAVLTLDSSETENQVYTTGDGGRTWQGPTIVAEGPRHKRFDRWFAYSPLGQLLLVWRTWEGTPDSPMTPYDTWAAVGRVNSRGAVFSVPVRVSSRAGKYAPQCLGGVLSGCIDSFSYITAARQYVDVGWGDSRSGEQQVWFSRIPLRDFKFTCTVPHASGLPGRPVGHSEMECIAPVGNLR